MIDQTEWMLNAVDLTKCYPDGQVQALRGVSLAVRPGESVAIMGPSGCGKSTLLNLLGALDTPDTGTVYFRGQALTAMLSLDRFRAEQIGFVFQSFYLLPALTALENVQVPMFGVCRSPSKRQAKARELLALVGMTHRANHHPARMSVGERQRIALARALANDPPVLLADEPTGNLDSRTTEEILDLLAMLQRERELTMVIVTHSQEVADRADRLVRMRDGRVVEDSHLSGTLHISDGLTPAAR